MQRNTPGQTWGVVWVLILGIAVIVAAALPGRSVVGTVDDQPPGMDELSVATALVAAKHSSGGLKIAGIRLKDKTYRLDLQYLGSADCRAGSGDTLCAGPDGLVGEIMGRTADGQAIVGTRIEVSRACYTLLDTGDPWPSHAECKGITG